MPKVVRVFSVVAIAAAMLTTGLIQASPARAKGEIAVVNVQKAVRMCAAGKKALALLKAKKDALESEVNKLRKKLERMQRDLSKTAMMLKPEAKLAKQMELQRLARKYRIRQEDARREFAEAEQLILRPIFRRMILVIRGLGARGGYTVIQEARTAIYFKSSVDITDKVVAAYNKKYPR